MVRRLAKAIREASGNGAEAKLKRAKLRHRLLTQLPDRLSGGKLSRSYRAMEVVVREWMVAASGWPSAFDGLRIGHVTDLHAGELITPEHAAGIVAQLRGRGVDMVVCTGDVTDLDPDHAVEPLNMLGSLEAPLGSYLVLGNHDALQCAEAVASAARRAGVKVLRNQAISLRRRDALLRVGGVEWADTVAACATTVDLAAAEPHGRPDLLLAHNPKAFRRAVQLSVPLTLSGHTHGGQLALRRREPTFPRRAAWRRLHAGPYVDGSSHLYVSSGAGSWFPMRVNRPPEVVVLTVRSA